LKQVAGQTPSPIHPPSVGARRAVRHHSPPVELDALIVMPNRVHRVIVVRCRGKACGFGGCFAPTETLVAGRHPPTPGIPTIRTGDDDRKDAVSCWRMNLERVTRFERATPCLGSTGGSSTLGLEPKRWFRLLASGSCRSPIISQASCRHLNSRPTPS